MILTDKSILEAISNNDIVIQPFDKKNLGSNSYDVHLGKIIGTYDKAVLDAKYHNKLRREEIPREGMVLYPGILYLGVTEEYTETHKHIPFLEGKSSTGRLGISIHATAGKGDIGFCNHWTLEISVIQPVRIYAGMPIGQLIYFQPSSGVLTPYIQKHNAKYKTVSTLPMGSMMHKNNF